MTDHASLNDMYKVIHIVSSNSTDHADKVQKGLDQIGEAEIYSVQHSIGAMQPHWGFSTVIIYRVYEK